MQFYTAMRDWINETSNVFRELLGVHLLSTLPSLINKPNIPLDQVIYLYLDAFRKAKNQKEAWTLAECLLLSIGNFFMREVQKPDLAERLANPEFRADIFRIAGYPEELVREIIETYCKWKVKTRSVRKIKTSTFRKSETRSFPGYFPPDLDFVFSSL